MSLLVAILPSSVLFKNPASDPLPSWLSSLYLSTCRTISAGSVPKRRWMWGEKESRDDRDGYNQRRVKRSWAMHVKGVGVYLPAFTGAVTFHVIKVQKQATCYVIFNFANNIRLSCFLFSRFFPMYNISKILLTILLSFKKLSDANICKLWTTISILTFENTFEYILAICYSTTKVFSLKLPHSLNF